MLCHTLRTAALPLALVGAGLLADSHLTAGAQDTPPAQAEQADAKELAEVRLVRAAEIEVSAALRAAVANEARPEQDRARDADRKPAEVLAFFGIRPGMSVADMMAASGYYTEILADAVGEQGELWVQNNEFVLSRYANGPLTERLERMDRPNVLRLDREVEDPGLPPQLDAVLLIRFYHDLYWMEADRAAMNRAIYAALEPGGVYGVIDHHAEEGSQDRDVQTLHRVDAAMVRREIEAAGFVLEAETDLLANPADARDKSVFAEGGESRDKTDRFVWRFRKPREPRIGGR